MQLVFLFPQRAGVAMRGGASIWEPRPRLVRKTTSDMRFSQARGDWQSGSAIK